MDRWAAMRVFAEVVEAGSFTAAARRAGLTKARVSQTVTALEELLGVVLLQRTTRSSHLTEAGERYYRRCRELLGELDALESSLGDDRDALAGTLRVTAPPGLASRYLSQLTEDFSRSHPEVRIDLQLTHRMVDLVEQGIDVAIRVTEPEDSSLIARKLAPAPLVLVAAPGYLERHGTPSRPEELRDYACLVDTNFRDQQRWRFKSAGRTKTITVQGPFRVNSPTAICDLAVAGWGLALTPKFVVEELLDAGSLVEVLPNTVAFQWGIYALYPRRSFLPSRVRAYLDHLSTTFE